MLRQYHTHVKERRRGYSIDVYTIIMQQYCNYDTYAKRLLAGKCDIAHPLPKHGIVSRRALLCGLWAVSIVYAQ